MQPPTTYAVSSSHPSASGAAHGSLRSASGGLGGGNDRGATGGRTPWRRGYNLLPGVRGPDIVRGVPAGRPNQAAVL